MLSFDYRKHDGETGRREVEPLRLANYGRRWYLLAWDRTREDWRSFRVDRIDAPPRVGAAFVPRAMPADAAQRLERGIAYSPFSCRATLRLEGTVAELEAVMPLWFGILEAESDTHSLLRVGADSAESLVAQVLMVGRPMTLVDCTEDPDEIQRLLKRAAAVFAAPGSA